MADERFVWYTGGEKGRDFLKKAAERSKITLRRGSPPSPGEAEELASSLLDLFIKFGHDGDYNPTPDGLVIESLIDSLSRYYEDGDREEN